MSVIDAPMHEDVDVRCEECGWSGADTETDPWAADDTTEGHETAMFGDPPDCCPECGTAVVYPLDPRRPPVKRTAGGPAHASPDPLSDADPLDEGGDGA